MPDRVVADVAMLHACAEAVAGSTSHAIEAIQAMGVQIAVLLNAGTTPDEAVMAYAVADTSGLDRPLADRCRNHAGTVPHGCGKDIHSISTAVEQVFGGIRSLD